MSTISEKTANHLRRLQEVCWKNSEDKGFHDNEPTDLDELAIYNGNRLMLIVSEAVEAHDELRNGWEANETYYPTQVNEWAEDQDAPGPHKPEGVPSEIADIVIRCFDFAGSNNFDLANIIQEKLAYNSTREHMHGKKF